MTRKDIIKDIIQVGTLFISLVIFVGTNLGLARMCLRVAELSDSEVAGLTGPVRCGEPDVVPVSGLTDVGTLGGVALSVSAGELSGVSPGQWRA